MKDYKYFIFDLYGTLVDIHTDEFNDRLWNKFKAILSQYEAHYTKDELRLAYFNKVSEIENKKAKTNHDIEIDIYDVFKYLFTNKGIKTNEETIKKIAIEFRKLSTTHIRKYSNVDRLLLELKKHNKKIYLLSNAQSLFTFYELQQLDLLKYFDDIFISSDIGYKKPDVLFLDKLIKKHKLDKDKCLFIGNDLNSDILCANRANIDSYYIHSNLSSKENKKIHPTYKQDGMNINKLINNLKLSH